MDEKRHIRNCRIVCTSIMIISILTFLVISIVLNNYYYLLLLIYVVPILSLFLIPNFLLKYKIYKYQNYEIVVYAGVYNHYLKINDKICDEYKSSFYFTPIILSATVDGQEFSARISLSNSITLKINNILFKN